MRYVYTILFIFLVSCGDSQETPPIIEEKKELTFDPAISQMQVSGKATETANSWIAYQKFITELENFDHSTAAALRLNSTIDDMVASIPEKWTSQPVKSRLKVLETRVKAYHALLTHNRHETMVQQKRFDQLILALDQFKIQIMEAYELEKSDKDLIKNLEELELDLEETDTINL
ncbi:hypothetical protein [Nonlabens sp.]|uniref:hypothetical protein n=1 Tax=Nonlabens sp. TaxID=1888209 RepID=UPI003F699924